MSLNLGAATAAMNNFFSEFSPSQWKNDLFYRNRRNEEPIGGTPVLTAGEEVYRSGEHQHFNNIRGILAIDAVPFDKSKALFFQFNPETINDAKTVEYADRLKPGFDNADYIWSKGGGRVITFELTLDASLSSLSLNIPTSNQFTHDLNRGTLNQVEFLQSLLRPYHSDGTVPLFSSNGVVPNTNRFASPPQVIFSYGPLYLVGAVTDVQIVHEAFNRNLAPIRTKANVSFRVREDIAVKKGEQFSQENSIGAVASSPKTLQSTTA